MNRAVNTSPGVLLWLALTTLVLLVLPASDARAQEAEEPVYTLRILDIEHDPAGSIEVSVRVGGATDVEPPVFTMVVDGIPQNVNTTPTREVDDLAIMLVIDTSGSMLGAPLEAAREAAIALIDQLNDGDQVSIVRFSNTVSLALDFTTDRAAARSVLNSLVAQGDTALYDTAAFTAEILAGVEPSRSNLILLSDGEESGASSAERQASIDALIDSGATAFSFGLGTSSDTEYLRAVAEGTGGEFWEVVDDRNLGSLFGSLGGRLGATDLVQVDTRPFAIGPHSAQIFATVMGQRLSASAEFEVTNPSLVQITSVETGEPGELIAITTSMLVDPTSVRLEASTGETALSFNSDGSLAIDPWRFDPGTIEVDVRAFVSAGLAGFATVELTIPTLAPILTVDQPESGPITVRQRVQGLAASTLVIRDGDRELASTANAELLFVLTEGTGDLTIELLDASGAVLATDSLAALPVAQSSGGGGLPLLPIGAVVAVVAAAVLFLYQRRDRVAHPPPLRVRAPRRVAPREAPLDVQLGTLIVRATDGTEHTYRIGPRPLTVGRSPSCDIPLDDPDIRPVHARISASPGGQFRIHGLSTRAAPYQQQQHDEWLIVSAGEEVAIASFIVRMEAVTAVAS